MIWGTIAVNGEGGQVLCRTRRTGRPPVVDTGAMWPRPEVKDPHGEPTGDVR